MCSGTTDNRDTYIWDADDAVFSKPWYTHPHIHIIINIDVIKFELLTIIIDL